MSPYPIAAPPSEEELLTAHREEPGPAQHPNPDRTELPEERRAEPSAYRQRELFAEALLDMSSTRPPRRSLDFVLSLMVHTILVGLLVMVPLIYTEAIDLRQFTQTFLVAPPPPPPPPPASPLVAKMAAAPRRVFTAGKLLAPTVIPEKVAMLKEEPMPPDLGLAGVVGGVPGGQAGGVIGGIISGAQRTYIPVAPKASTPKAPVRVGGRVKPPRPLSTPQPQYPILARQATIQGDVLIDAVIDTDGSVIEMHVVSGHPLLIPAAMEALRRWKYEPTILNDQPVAVQLFVTIKFRLQ